MEEGKGERITVKTSPPPANATRVCLGGQVPFLAESSAHVPSPHQTCLLTCVAGPLKCKIPGE